MAGYYAGRRQAAPAHIQSPHSEVVGPTGPDSIMTPPRGWPCAPAAQAPCEAGLRYYAPQRYIIVGGVTGSPPVSCWSLQVTRRRLECCTFSASAPTLYLSALPVWVLLPLLAHDIVTRNVPISWRAPTAQRFKERGVSRLGSRRRASLVQHSGSGTPGSAQSCG